MFEKLMEAEEDYEAYLENENEYYVQSYTGSTKVDYPWEEGEGEEGEGKKESKGSGEEGPGLTEEEQEEERKRKIKEINQRTKEKAKEKEKEMEGFQYPHDYTKEWKEYSEDGQIYRQHYVTKVPPTHFRIVAVSLTRTYIHISLRMYACMCRYIWLCMCM